MRVLLLTLFGCLLVSLPLSLLVAASLRMGARETAQVVVSTWGLLVLCLGLVWGDQLPDSKLRATMTNDYTSLEQAEIAKLRARLELVASQLNAAWSKRDDAPASAAYHLQEALCAVFASAGPTK